MFPIRYVVGSLLEGKILLSLLKLILSQSLLEGGTHAVLQFRQSMRLRKASRDISSGGCPLCAALRTIVCRGV